MSCSLQDLEKRVKALESQKIKKEKKPRDKSDYNIFMGKKITEIKSKDPTISHKTAFSDAVAEWNKQKKDST